MSACRFLYPCKFTYIKFKTFFTAHFRLAKSSIILLTSSFRASAFSIDKTARPLNPSSCIMFRRYVLINFNLENDLSAVATVTWQREKQKTLIFKKNCYLVLAGGPPRVVGPGAPHHLHHLYGRHWIAYKATESLITESKQETKHALKSR